MTSLSNFKPEPPPKTARKRKGGTTEKLTAMPSLASTTASASSGAKKLGGKYEDFEKALDMQMHRQRVEKMGPDVNTDAPISVYYKHLKENLKGRQTAAEKQAEIERLNIMMGERLKTTPSLSGLPPYRGPEKKVQESAATWPERMERACLAGDMPLLNQTLFHVGVEDLLPRAAWCDGV